MSLLSVNPTVSADIKRLSDQASAIAASTGDATTVTGTTIDRQGFAGGSIPTGLALGILYSATLASASALTLAAYVQDSPDGTNWSMFATYSSVTVASGPSGGGVVAGSWNNSADLRGARRYVRALFIPDLLRTGTDTAVAIACGMFTGWDRLPAPIA